MSFAIAPEWVHIQYPETTQFREVYGFAGAQGLVNLEGIRFLPEGSRRRPLRSFMHPATTLQLLPVPQALAKAGVHAKREPAKEKWGYEKVVLCGWSGGGSLSLFYQAQAQNPSITHTPAGDEVNLKEAKLIAADALIFQAAHLSRARIFAEWVDPSVMEETDPDPRDLELDIYNPKCPNQPPYSDDFVRAFRSA